MKKRNRFLCLVVSLFMLGASALAFLPTNSTKEVSAKSTQLGFAGQSGQILCVTGGYFSTSTPLAVYFFNNSGSAWTNKVSDRLSEGQFEVMTPYLNGSSTTWSKIIVCQYDNNYEPSVDGFTGRIKQSPDIPIGETFLYGKNCLNITGESDGQFTYASSVKMHYGIQSEERLYLDLTELPDWESQYAKMAVYFAYPSARSGEGWSQQYSSDHSYLESAFCWKVSGQSNPYLYECIVPKLDGLSVIWSMVIGVRLNSSAPNPSFDYAWNQTQNLVFGSADHDSNIIRVTDNGGNWSGGGYIIDQEYRINDDTRASFYGQYFLDTVACSGSGNSDATTSEMWSNVESEYQRHLSTAVEGIVWLAEADEEGSIIEQAMARYDYIVFYKHYSHNDFINRSANNEAGYLTQTNLVNNNIYIIVSVVALSSLSVLAFIIIRKRKEN